MSEIIPLAKKYYYTTPEYIGVFLNKIYKSSGALYLTTTSFTLENIPFDLHIPFIAITSINIGFFSRWIRPIPTAYLEITYIEDGQNKTVFLVPGDAGLVWNVNRHIERWLETFDQIDELKTRIKHPLPRLPTSPTLNDLMIFFLVIAGGGYCLWGLFRCFVFFKLAATIIM